MVYDDFFGPERLFHRFPGATGRAGRTSQDPPGRAGRGRHWRATRQDRRGAAGVRRARPGQAGRQRGGSEGVRGGTSGAVQADLRWRAVRRIAAEERGRQDLAAGTQGRVRKNRRRQVMIAGSRAVSLVQRRSITVYLK